MIDELTASSHV